MTAAQDQIIHAFESLTIDSVTRLSLLYAEGAHFKDPFNQVQGRDAIAHIFTHMFTQVDSPRFVVTTQAQQDQNLFMCWDFHFHARGSERLIRGSTHFVLNTAGLITLHRDYWDAAQELYETLPVLGPLLRWLRKKLSASQA